MENISNIFSNKDFKYIFIFLALLGFAGTSTSAVIISHNTTQLSKNAQLQEKSFDYFHPNTDFKKAEQAYKQNPTKDNLTALVIAAQLRKSVLHLEINANPDLFLSNVLPGDERKSLPGEVQPYLEQDVNTKGGVSWFHADSFFSSQEVESYSLDSRYGLHFQSNLSPPLPKTYITATGVTLDSDLVLTHYQQQVNGLTPGASSLIPGNDHVYVILVNFSGNTPPKHTLDQIKNTLMGSGDEQGVAAVSTYYKEASFGQQTFTFDFHDWITIQGTGSGYSCDWSGENAIRQALDKAVADSHVVLDANSTRVYYTNATFCAPGTGSINVEYGLGYPSVVVPNDGDGTGILAHELGHTLGLNHAAGRSCKNANDYTSSCTDTEYGDGYDIMGGPLNHFNAPHKIELGYINSGQVQTVTTNGTYTITPLETQSLGKQVIKIAKKDAAGWYYYLEYRTNTGFDNSVPVSIQVHLWNEQINSNDPWHPGSPYPYHTYRVEPILSDGQTFTDSINHTTITMVSHDVSKATVTINTGTATTDTPVPTVTVTPGSNLPTDTPMPAPQYTCNANAILQSCIANSNPCQLQAVGTCISGQICCSALQL